MIRILGLKPHPEGGHYRETFRDDRGDGARAASTAIYFLLAEGEVSRWHRVDAAEVWHWHAGAPLALSIAPPDGMPRWTFASAPTSPPASARRASCRPAIGKAPPASAPGRWSVARWRRDLCSTQFEMAEEGFSPPRR